MKNNQNLDSNTKWFKHSSTLSKTPLMREIRDKFGTAGYGGYILCLELILSGVDEFDALEKKFCEYPLTPRAPEILKYFIEIGLFEVKDNVVIHNPKKFNGGVL